MTLVFSCDCWCFGNVIQEATHQEGTPMKQWMQRCSDYCRGIEFANDNAIYLIPILEEWLVTMERYVRWSRKDNHETVIEVPWNWDERANVAFLGAAAWRAGCLTLNEFSSDKGRKDGASKGRGDLSLIFPSTAPKQKERMILVEAKIVWDSRRVEPQLENACEDAAAHKSTRYNRRYGAIFLVPHFEKEPTCREIKDTLKAVTKINPDVAAWCFPLEARSYSEEKNKKFYPGIILAFKRPRGQ